MGVIRRLLMARRGRPALYANVPWGYGQAQGYPYLGLPGEEILHPQERKFLEWGQKKDARRAYIDALRRALDNQPGVLPTRAELEALMHAGRSVRGEYGQAANRLAEVIGPEQAALWSALSGIASAQTKWQEHSGGGMALLGEWERAGRPTGPKAVEKIVERAGAQRHPDVNAAGKPIMTSPWGWALNSKKIKLPKFQALLGRLRERHMAGLAALHDPRTRARAARDFIAQPNSWKTPNFATAGMPGPWGDPHGVPVDYVMGMFASPTPTTIDKAYGELRNDPKFDPTGEVRAWMDEAVRRHGLAAHDPAHPVLEEVGGMRPRVVGRGQTHDPLGNKLIRLLKAAQEKTIYEPQHGLAYKSLIGQIAHEHGYDEAREAQEQPWAAGLGVRAVKDLDPQGENRPRDHLTQEAVRANWDILGTLAQERSRDAMLQAGKRHGMVSRDFDDLVRQVGRRAPTGATPLALPAHLQGPFDRVAARIPAGQLNAGEDARRVLEHFPLPQKKARRRSAFARLGRVLRYERASRAEQHAYSQALGSVVRKNLAQRFGGTIPPHVEPHVRELERQGAAGELAGHAFRAHADHDRGRDAVAALTDPNHPAYRLYDPAAHGSFVHRMHKALFYHAKHGKSEEQHRDRGFGGGAPAEGEPGLDELAFRTQGGRGGRKTSELRGSTPEEQIQDMLRAQLPPGVKRVSQAALGRAAGVKQSWAHELVKRALKNNPDIDPAKVIPPRYADRIMELVRAGKTLKEITGMRNPDGTPVFPANAVRTVVSRRRRKGDPAAAREKVVGLSMPQRVAEMVAAGHKPAAIAAKLGISQKAAWAAASRARQQGLAPPSGPSVQEQIHQMLSGGKSTQEVAAALGRPHQYVQVVRSQLRAKHRQAGKPVPYSRPGHVEHFRFKPGVPGGYQTALAVARSRAAMAVSKAIGKSLGALGVHPHRVSRAVLSAGGRFLPAAIASIYRDIPDHRMLAAAGWQGLMGQLPGVVAFKPHPMGPDQLHRVEHSGPVGELVKKLHAAGAFTHVLIPTRGGTTALVYDKGGRRVPYLRGAGISFASASGHGASFGKNQLRDAARLGDQTNADDPADPHPAGRPDQFAVGQRAHAHPRGGYRARV